jgi:hypothetical protein
MESTIISTLILNPGGKTALEISRLINGKKGRAKDVNSILYNLLKQQKLNMYQETSRSRPIWSIQHSLTRSQSF